MILGFVEASGPRVERLRRSGARVWAVGDEVDRVEVWVVIGCREDKDILEALREGGPRKRDGGGGLWGCLGSGLEFAVEGDNVAIVASLIAAQAVLLYIMPSSSPFAIDKQFLQWNN